MIIKITKEEKILHSLLITNKKRYSATITDGLLVSTPEVTVTAQQSLKALT